MLWRMCFCAAACTFARIVKSTPPPQRQLAQDRQRLPQAQERQRHHAVDWRALALKGENPRRQSASAIDRLWQGEGCRRVVAPVALAADEAAETVPGGYQEWRQ